MGNNTVVFNFYLTQQIYKCTYIQFMFRPNEHHLKANEINFTAEEDPDITLNMYSCSDAQGIENPVFDDPPAANPEQRPRLIFMASRQPSDSGRHLLSEPNTPLSPPGPNDVFFPSLGKFHLKVF